MLTRLTHAAIAFAVTAVLYQGYVLAVVPFVEPAASAAPAGAAAVEEAFELPADGGAAIVEKFHPLLSTYFPANHWSLARPPFLLETSAPGVFAVGDVRAGNIKRVASAVGEGSIAVSFVHRSLEN